MIIETDTVIKVEVTITESGGLHPQPASFAIVALDDALNDLSENPDLLAAIAGVLPGLTVSPYVISNNPTYAPVFTKVAPANTDVTP